VLKGPENNPLGVGCGVSIQTADGSCQFVEQQLTRGYLSSISPVLHFGLGENNVISKLTVKWPDGNVQQLNDVNANQTLELDYVTSVSDNKSAVGAPSTIFHEIDFEGIHQEDNYDDYRYQVLLPHKLSQLGPAMATGDVNGDGNDDMYVGGSSGYSGSIYIQEAGTFIFAGNQPFSEHKISEDTGALFFDADGDNDLDLYVVSGSNEREEGSEYYQDRLYINDGDGNFSYDSEALPDLRLSGQEVSAYDFDSDGDFDLFVGGRQIPRKWPEPASSVLLLNEPAAGRVRFIDVTSQLAPELLNIGLVTSSIWTDIEGDGDIDLVLAGEWMPLTVFRYENSKLSKDNSFFTGSTGWWYRLQSADLDDDGDQDIIAGNLGLNYKYQASEEQPFEVYAGFMDQNRIYDVVLGYYQEGQQYPVRGRQCSSQQMPGIKYKFPTYDQFAQSTLQEIYEPEMLETANHFSVKSFASGIYFNQGNGNYQFESFDNQVQISSINGIVVDDFNEDGKQDILTAGNLYVSEVETTRNDASVGLLLSGSQRGFSPVTLAQSGFYAPGDVKNIMVAENAGGEKFVVVANNNDKVQVFRYNF
jgi:hypothetical protein